MKRTKEDPFFTADYFFPRKAILLFVRALLHADSRRTFLQVVFIVNQVALALAILAVSTESFQFGWRTHIIAAITFVFRFLIFSHLLVSRRAVSSESFMVNERRGFGHTRTTSCLRSRPEIGTRGCRPRSWPRRFSSRRWRTRA